MKKIDKIAQKAIELEFCNYLYLLSPNMIPFRKSIGCRLLIVSFILLALPLLVDSFILIEQRYRHTIEEAKNYLVDVSRLRELPLKQLQPLNKPLLEVLARYLNLRDNFPDEPSQELDTKLEKLAVAGNFHGIFLLKITPEGRDIVVGSSIPGNLGKDYTDYFKLGDLFSEEAKEQGYLNYITFESKSSESFFIVTYPIYDRMGRAVGILVIGDNITNKLPDLLKPDTYFYQVNFGLLLPSSVVFASSDPNLRFQYFFPLKPEYRRLFNSYIEGSGEPVLQELLADHPIEVDPKIGYPFFEFDWDGEKQIGYLKELPGENFLLLSYASKNNIFKTPLAHFFDIFIVYAAILIIGGVIATILTMRMTKPIRSLSSVMERIQKGDLQLRYKKDFLGFEINKLGHFFNEMVDAILEQKRVAQEQRVQRETVARELRLGQQVQRNLLPRSMPNCPGVDLAETYIPAIEVGGDFYDLFMKENGQLVLSIADASGKGVLACFYSLSIRNMLRTYAQEYDDISATMVSANNLFCQLTGETGMFVTALMGTYDPKNHRFNYYSCGHNPPLIRRKNGEVEILDHLEIAMGFKVLGNIKGKDHSTQLEQGDILIFYTDGITEAHNLENQLYGEKRLVECLEKVEPESASGVIDQIIKDVNAFVGKAHQHDDITVVVMKVTE